MKTIDLVIELLEKEMSKLSLEQKGILKTPDEAITFFLCHSYAESLIDLSINDLTLLLMEGYPIVDTTWDGLTDELENIEIQNIDSFVNEVINLCFTISENGEIPKIGI